MLVIPFLFTNDNDDVDDDDNDDNNDNDDNDDNDDTGGDNGIDDGGGGILWKVYPCTLQNVMNTNNNTIIIIIFSYY